MDNQISFTQQIKEELTNLTFKDDYYISLLSSFIRITGTIVISKSNNKLVLKSENSKVVKYIYSLLKKFFPEITISFTYRRRMKFYKSIEYLINIIGDDDIEAIFKFLKIDFLSNNIEYLIINSQDKIRGYLTGIFLATGSCNSPKSSNYHLEMYTNDEEYSKSILKLFNKIKPFSFDFKLVKRRNNYVLYLKKSSLISDFLAYLNASNSCLYFENIRVDRDFFNVNNRLINMDTYNFNKTVLKSKEQIKYIDIIDKKLGIKNIANKKLRELCYLRKEHMEASYQELAILLSEKINSEVSKSNINHLFISLKNKAKELDCE